MSRGNDVFKVLVPTTFVADAAPAALASLAEGTLGFYTYPDNTPIDPSAAVAGTDFYMAVGIKNLSGQADINKSSGTHIQAKNIVDVNVQDFVAAQEMVTNNVMKVITCGDEIGVRVEIRNQQAYRINGYNQVVKTFLVPTSECVDCATDCSDANCIDVLDSLVALINSDEDGLFVATKSDPSDCDTADGELILTVNAAAFESFCNINLNYFNPRQTEVIVTPINGFEETTITTEMVFEQGSGYDVKQMEYDAGGFSGKPGVYRTYADGLAKSGFQYFAVEGSEYSVLNVSYDQASISGWRGDVSFERTVVASTATITAAVKAAIDALIG